LSFYSCSNEQGGGTPLGEQPVCAQSGGKMEVTLTSEGNRKVGFSVTPQCLNQTDYLICDINIFNDNIPDPSVIPNVSPLIYTWQRSETCAAYSSTPLVETEIDCQFACTDNCVWITVQCLNTTQGTSLTISSMPQNVNCL